MALQRTPVPRTIALGLALAAAVAVGCSDAERSGSDEPFVTPSVTPSAEVGAQLRPPLVVPLEGRPSAVAHSEGVLWVADDERGVIHRLSDADGSVVGAPVAISPQPTALAVAGDLLWVADAGGIVTALDTDTAQPRHEPFHLGGVLVAITASESTAWVGDIEAGTVRAIDADTGVAGSAVDVPSGVVRIELVGQVLWVSGLESSLTPVDTQTLSVGDPITVGQAPIGMAAFEGLLWVANSDADTVSRIDVESGRRVGADMPVGDAPIALVIVGDEAWVLDQDGPSLTRLDVGEGGRLGEPLVLSTRPRGLVTSPTGVWVVGVDPSVAILYAPR